MRSINFSLYQKFKLKKKRTLEDEFLIENCKIITKSETLQR